MTDHITVTRTFAAPLIPVTVDLVEVDGGTEITLTQQTPGWPEEARVGLVAGYNSFLDSMQLVIDRVR